MRRFESCRGHVVPEENARPSLRSPSSNGLALRSPRPVDPGLVAEGDAAVRPIRRLVVTDFKPEGFEQPPQNLARSCREVSLSGWKFIQKIERARIRLRYILLKPVLESWACVIYSLERPNHDPAI